MKKLLVLSSIFLTIFLIMTTFTSATYVEEHPEILSISSTLQEDRS